MDKDWLGRLKTAEKSLSRTELNFVDFVNQHPEKAAALTLKDLSDETEISKPLIISCFRKLDYPDYKSFQVSVEMFFSSQIDSLRASRNVHDRAASLEELVKEAASVDTGAITRMAETLNAKTLSEIVSRIHESRLVYTIGEGTGNYPAHYLAERLKRYGVCSFGADQDQRHWPDMLHPLRGQDLVILFHYSDSDTSLLKILRYLNQKCVPCILVSGTIRPEYVDQSTVFQHVSRGEIHFKNSMALPMHFANLILLAFELKYAKECEDELITFENSRNEWDRDK